MLGIICAMELEVEGLLQALQKKSEVVRSGIVFHGGRLGSVPVVIAQCGIGKVNAAICCQLMVDLFNPDAIINSGVGGALSEEVTLGDLIVADYAVQHDFDTTAFGDPKGLLDLGGTTLVKLPMSEEIGDRLYSAARAMKLGRVLRGTIATGDRFITDTEARLALGREFGAIACEMEGGAIAQVCYRARVPFCIVRCISDDIGHSTSMSYDEFKTMAAKKTVDLLTRALT